MGQELWAKLEPIWTKPGTVEAHQKELRVESCHREGKPSRMIISGISTCGLKALVYTSYIGLGQHRKVSVMVKKFLEH